MLMAEDTENSAATDEDWYKDWLRQSEQLLWESWEPKKIDIFGGHESVWGASVEMDEDWETDSSRLREQLLREPREFDIVSIHAIPDYSRLSRGRPYTIEQSLRQSREFDIFSSPVIPDYSRLSRGRPYTIEQLCDGFWTGFFVGMTCSVMLIGMLNQFNPNLKSPQPFCICPPTIQEQLATFEDFKLSQEVLKGLYVMGFKKPSKIQAISVPMILTPPYKDLIAQAHNGSGKTTCFMLGMLCRVDSSFKRPQALCICPTTELCIQNIEVLRKMGEYTGIVAELAAAPLKNVESYGSRSRPQISAQIVIGTPVTVKRLMSQKMLSVTDVKVLVFDEADYTLAKDDFRDDSFKIMKDIERAKANCQVLLFSATYDESVMNFVSRIVKQDHNRLFVKREELSVDAVKQYKVYCPNEDAKISVIKDRILELGEKRGQSIIFVNSRSSAGNLHKALVGLGYGVSNIHGPLTHENRDRIVKEFKDCSTQILIATDLLARGFDQKQVNLVVNYDLPVKYEMQSEPHFEVYLHRIGRVGRFGRKGAVFNFLMHDSDKMIMENIEKHFGAKVTEVPSWSSEEDFKVALKDAGLL